MKIQNVTNRLVPGVIGLVMALGLLLISVPAVAVPTLKFEISAPPAGVISFDGNSNPLLGTDIDVDSVVGLGTFQNNGVTATCINCVLDFVTGGSTSAAWEFASGGSITVIGGVDFDGGGIGPGDILEETTLLTGSFSGFQQVFDLGVGNMKLVATAFGDSKEKALTDFYGLPDGMYEGTFALFFTTPANIILGDSFTSNAVISGTILNTPIPSPEPASLLLLGSGLVGFGILRWRKKLV